MSIPTVFDEPQVASACDESNLLYVESDLGMSGHIHKMEADESAPKTSLVCARWPHYAGVRRRVADIAPWSSVNRDF